MLDEEQKVIDGTKDLDSKYVFGPDYLSRTKAEIFWSNIGEDKFA